MKKIYLLTVCVTLSGCETIGNWADDVGTHLPVLSDQPCEHWQCFTDDGKAQSEYNKQMREKRWKQEEMEEKGEQAPTQPNQQQVPLQQPPGYNPPPEMDPWNNYQP